MKIEIGSTEKKRSLKITELLIYIILLPFILAFLVQTILLLPTLPSAYMAQLSGRFLINCFEFVSTWEGLLMAVLYVVLGVGVICFYNAARLGMIVLTLGAAILGPAAFITAAVIAGPIVHKYFIKVYGVFPIIIICMIIAFFSLASGLIAFYLTLPKVKEQFR